MRKIEKTVYKYDELSEEAKQKVLEYFADIDYQWYEYITDTDAKEVDLDILEFDTDKGNIDVQFRYRAKDTAEAIIEKHGETTDTYKIAKEFLEKFNVAEEQEAKYHDLYENLEPETDEDYELESEYENERDWATDEMEELSDEFLKELGSEYLSMLRQEYEYLTSEEYIEELIEANDYEFYENGELYN